MAKVTLDSIRESAEKKYGAFEIEMGDGSVVRLLNVLRLPRDVRAKLASVNSESFSEETLDDELINMVKSIAETPEQADRLLRSVATGDGSPDMAMLATIIEQYSEGTEVGEA